MADVQGMGTWFGVRPLGFPGDGGVVSVSVAFYLGFLVGVEIWLLGSAGRGAVWGDIACGAGCGPLKLQGWSKIEHSFVGVWP